MGKKQKSTTKAEPFTGQAKEWAYGFQPTVYNRATTPTKAYEGQLSTGLSDTQKTAIGGLNSLINTQALTDTISGKYLDPSTNKYLEQTYDLAADKVSKSLGQMNDNVNSQFNARGLYNSSAREERLTEQKNDAADTLTGLANSIYGTAYTNERNNQMNAINQQGNLINSQFGQGTTQQGIEQSALDKEYRDFIRQQGQDTANVNLYLQYLNTIKNPTQTTTSSGGGGLLGTVAGASLGGWAGRGFKW